MSYYSLKLSLYRVNEHTLHWVSLAVIPFLSDNQSIPIAPIHIAGPSHWLHFLDHGCGQVYQSRPLSPATPVTPPPRNSVLGPTEQLSLWVAEAEGLRICKEPFHRHVTKVTIHNERKIDPPKTRDNQVPFLVISKALPHYHP